LLSIYFREPDQGKMLRTEIGYFGPEIHPPMRRRSEMDSTNRHDLATRLQHREPEGHRNPSHRQHRTRAGQHRQAGRRFGRYRLAGKAAEGSGREQGRRSPGPVPQANHRKGQAEPV